MRWSRSRSEGTRFVCGIVGSEMQDRRNHWREASFQQNRFSNAESFSSYPVDQNELSLISEQERGIL